MKKLTQITMILLVIISISGCQKQTMQQKSLDSEDLNSENSLISDVLNNEQTLENNEVQEEVAEEEPEEPEEPEEEYYDAFQIINLSVQKAIEFQNVDYYLQREHFNGARYASSEESPYNLCFPVSITIDMFLERELSPTDNLNDFNEPIVFIHIDFEKGGTVDYISYQNKTLKQIMEEDKEFSLYYDEMDNYWCLNKEIFKYGENYQFYIYFYNENDTAKLGGLRNT